jgi:hypothetical protein
MQVKQSMALFFHQFECDLGTDTCFKHFLDLI